MLLNFVLFCFENLGECEELNNRLQAVRNRVVELERGMSNLHMNCDKYQMVTKVHVRSTCVSIYALKYSINFFLKWGN